MRNRELTREQAVEEYLIYRKRMREFLDMAQITKDIKDGRYRPRDLMGRGPERFALTTGNALMGLFASLMDPQEHALNVFDVWLFLFPQRNDKINETWNEVKTHIKLIREYRNDVVAHANKNLQRYVKTQQKYGHKKQEIGKAMQRVLALAADLLEDEATALPDLRAEADPVLRTSFPGISGEQLEKLKDYFLYNGEAADSKASG
jgi:hypothetical protein